MTTVYHRFKPVRELTEYRGQAGPHNGNALDANAYAALAEYQTHGGLPMMFVRGEWVREDGARFLEFVVDKAWYEWRRGIASEATPAQ